MTLNLISLAIIKTQLGISVTTYDAALTALIPIVSNDIRRIIGNGFDKYEIAYFDETAAEIDLGIQAQLRNEPNFGVQQKKYQLGQVVYHPNLPSDTYLSAYNPNTGIYSLSATPTDAGDYVYPTISIAQWPAISKMIWYKYSKQNTNAALGMENLSSYSFGPVSKTFSDKEINRQWDYPQQLIDDLGLQYVKVG